jgi:hypothetical protein
MNNLKSLDKQVDNAWFRFLMCLFDVGILLLL